MAEQLRRGDAAVTSDDSIVLIDENWVVKAKPLD